MAARVAMASVRERLADGHWTASSLELRALDVSLPLAQRAAFELHGPDLDAPRAALLERPVALLDALWPTISAIEALPPNSQTRVRSELQDCVFNLALAEYAAARRDQLARARGRPVDAPSPLDPRAIDVPASESMPVAGHPWHPMCKTRLGLTLRENLRHAPELLGDGACAAVDVDARHVAAHGEYAALAPRLFPPAPRGLVRVAVHPAQLRALPSLLPCSWGQVIQRAALPPRPARALLSLRTVALEPPGEGSLHVKLALNVHTTSCARTVSPMSQANGPQLSALLERVQSVDPLTRGACACRPTSAAPGSARTCTATAPASSACSSASPPTRSRARSRPRTSRRSGCARPWASAPRVTTRR
ncbi:MAG: hypothetical protein H6713_37120 [Myxococcales bacterium]|nr:hypothetical protein [Myxococcales bacterium]